MDCVRSLASELMAEEGDIDPLANLAKELVAAGRADQARAWRWWFCPDEINHSHCGDATVEFSVHDEFERLTLVTMLGPSPDWFVGVSGLPLRDDTGWIRFQEIELLPYDGGTRSANEFALGGPLSEPPEVIHAITEDTGQLIGPASLGWLRVELLE